MLLPHRMPKSREIKLNRLKERQRQKLEKAGIELFKKSIDLNTELILKYKDEDIRIKEDLEKNGHVTYDGFMWQKRLSAEYNIFGRILGYIDSRLADIMTDINFESHFLDKNGTSEKYSQLQDAYIELETRRENIVKDYDEEIPQNSLSVINNAVKTKPSSDKFAEIFQDDIENRMQLPLQSEFVKAYNEGYLLARKNIKDKEVFSMYEESINLIKSKGETSIKVQQYTI